MEPLRHKDLEHLTFVIYGAPKIARLTVDLDEHLVEVPAPLRIASMIVNSPFPDLRGEYRTEAVPSEPHCLMADINTALEQQIFDLPK